MAASRGPGTPGNTKRLSWDSLIIGVSVSDVPASDLADRGLGPMHLEHGFWELTRHLLAMGTTVAYGGDHRVGGFTERLFDLVHTYDRQDKPNAARIRNYLAWPIHRTLSAASRNAVRDVATLMQIPLPPDVVADPVVTSLTPSQNLAADPAANRRIWTRTLTAMRQQMNADIHARILLGGRYGGLINGKLDRFLGKYPGLMEEAYLAIKSQKPLYLLGGFGGCTKVIIDALLGGTPAPLTESFQEQADAVYADMIKTQPLAPDDPIDYPAVLATFQSAGIAGLHNGLSDDDNARLFKTDYVDEMIALVLKGLKTFTAHS